MAFTVTFRTAGAAPPTSADLAAWLTERGEPFLEEGADTLVLRALPLRLITPKPAADPAPSEAEPPASRSFPTPSDAEPRASTPLPLAGPPSDGAPRAFTSTPPAAAATAPGKLVAHLDPTCVSQLIRLVDTVFHLAMRSGADVQLAGTGVVNRSSLWAVLAEEQDRQRIAAALERAREHGNADEVHKRLWAVLQSLRPGTDCRWDATLERVVELVDVGEQISVDDARFHEADATTGDVVQVPVEGMIHVLVWRWLSEAWPGLCEHDHSLH